MSQEVVWQRCRVLDRYEQYNAGRGGNGGRATYWKRRLGKAVFGGLATIGSWGRRQDPKDPCDVLFLHGWAGGPDSIAALGAELIQRGISYRDALVSGSTARLAGRLVQAPAYTVPYRWRLDAHYAQYLIDRFSPRVVVCFENASPLVTWLRLALHGRGFLVNLSHSVTPPGDEANMFDFDYYFGFGASSLDHARNKTTRIGTTQFVHTGYFWIGPDYQLPPTPRRDSVLFFSQLSDEFLRSRQIAPADKQLVMRNTRCLMDFALQHPEIIVYVKLHPLESSDAVTRMAVGTTNVRILPKSMSMKEAVALAPIAIVMWSNAALGAAVLGRPLIVLNDTDEPDAYLDLERFFLPRARTATDLHQRIVEVFRDYMAQVQAARRFVQRHLERTTDAVPYIASCLHSLARRRPDFPSILLPETLGGLTRLPASGRSHDG